MAARAALDAGFDVVVEGMMFAERYAEMLRTLTVDHEGTTRHWYFNASLDVTLGRHRHRPEAALVPTTSLRDWYRPDDLLPGVEQQLVLSDWPAQFTANQIVASTLTGPHRPPDLTT